MSGTELGKKVLTELMQENAKYLQGESLPQSELSSPELRRELSDRGQAPIAAIIACADSRVAPEIVFGAGLGKVFVVRNAGNVAWGDSVVGSLEYAVQHLNVPLVLVLGHTKCGAVGAAVASVGKGDGGSSLGKHVARIAEVVAGVVEKGGGVPEGVVENVKNAVARLRFGPHGVAAAARNGDIAVLGAVYDIESGEVAEIEV